MSAAKPRQARRPELSQHFLRGGALAPSLIEQASIERSDLVLEIGAGDGALTRPLQAAAGRVLAVELDPKLATALRRRFGDASNVEVVEADIRALELPSEPTRVFGNIPFALTAEIVRKVASTPSVRDAHLIVQREAAARFAGSPWAAEGRISLELKPWWHVEITRSLRRTDFSPPPRVDNVVLWLARRSPPLVREADRGAYERFLDRAFGTAATTRQALRRLFTSAQIRRLATDLGLDLRAPPSATRFEQWLALYRFWRLRARASERVSRSAARL